MVRCYYGETPNFLGPMPPSADDLATYPGARGEDDEITPRDCAICRRCERARSETMLPCRAYGDVDGVALTSANWTCGAPHPGSMLLPCMGTGEAPSTPLDRAMTRFAAGDDAALGDVYDLAAPAVFTFLLRLCRDHSLAEDLTQETFLRVHRARGLYRPGAAVMPWAYTIARRLFLDAVRARRSDAAVPGRGGAGGDTDPDPKMEVELAAHGSSAEDLLAQGELSKAVEDALTRIPETQAEAFRLLKGEGLSVTEAAAIMGTTRGAVKLRAHRAYEALRGMLSDHLFAAETRKIVPKKDVGKSVEKDVVEKDSDGGVA